MNHIGKFLVLIHTTISLLALAVAAGLFFQMTDWGWKEPRKELEGRIASEYDKRAAAHKEAIQVRDQVFPALAPAVQSYRDTEKRFSENHLFYVAELDKLKNAPGEIKVGEVKFKDGQLVLDPPGKNTGKPVLDDVNDLNKSYKTSLAEYEALQKEIAKASKDVLTATEKTRKITQALTGKDDAGKDFATGLYELLDKEHKAQQMARFEKDYLLPNWARAQEEAELFTLRRDRLEETLNRLLKQKQP